MENLTLKVGYRVRVMKTPAAVQRGIANRTGIILGLLNGSAKVRFDDGTTLVIDITHLMKVNTL